MRAVDDARDVLSCLEACTALGVPRASYYRSRGATSRAAPGSEGQTRVRTVSPRALSSAEQQLVLDVLHAPRFVDHAVPQVYATLLDEGVFHCSMRTMYRVLDAHGEVRERRDQLRRPNYTKPELLASVPNQVWSWDITKLRGPAKWTYYYLYVILDIFSRYVVGWMLARRETATLASKLIEETLLKQHITRDQLTIHADRGSSMTSKDVAFLLAELGVTKTHSRPHVSDDNPYSEAHFKTMKYRPTFPDRFGAIEDARGFCRPFFDWYNNQHRHSGIAWMTPADVHLGRVDNVRAIRARALDTAYQLHPERFVRKAPTPPRLPSAVWINPPPQATSAIAQ